MYLGANVLLPEGFEAHPKARYPLVINHGHFPYAMDTYREEPPDPNLKPDFSDRFQLEGYNRIQQQYAHEFFKDWTGPNYPPPSPQRWRGRPAGCRSPAAGGPALMAISSRVVAREYRFKA